MQDIAQQPKRNVGHLSVSVSGICFAGGGAMYAVTSEAGFLAAGVLFGVALASHLVMSEVAHEREIESKQIDVELELKRIEIERIHSENLKVFAALEFQREQIRRQKVLDDVAAQKKVDSELVEVNTRLGAKFLARDRVTPEMERIIPIVQNSIDSPLVSPKIISVWHDDDEMVSVTLQLMDDGKCPTQEEYWNVMPVKNVDRWKTVVNWLALNGLSTPIMSGVKTRFTNLGMSNEVREEFRAHVMGY